MKMAIQSFPAQITLTQYFTAPPKWQIIGQNFSSYGRKPCWFFIKIICQKIFIPGKGAEATKGIMTDHLAELFSNPHSIPLPLWGENNFTLLARASLSNQHVRLFFLFHDRQNIKDSLDCLKYTCSFESLGLHWRR